MIGDAREIESGQVVETGLCIVGAGAAGIALALQFEHSGRPVLVLESGGLHRQARIQALYAGTVANPALHPPLDTYRVRAFGGSTSLWGGRCAPFDAIDFEHRPWMPGSGWPFGYDELLPYYRRASRLCETGDFAYTAATAFPHGMSPMLPGFSETAFSATRFTDSTIERFSCPTDFARRYRRRLAAATNIIVLLHANVTELCTTNAGRSVTALRVATLTGRRFTVRAQRTVLATGGLEVPRLLLASRGAHTPHGIGNQHDQVGRHYMTHLAGTIGVLTPAAAAAQIGHGYAIADDGTYCRRRFALTEQAQRSLQIGNFIARLHHPRLHDPAHRTGALSAIFLARRFIRYEYAIRLRGEHKETQWRAHARNILLDLPGVANFAIHWLRNRVFAERKYPSLVVRPRSGRYSLDFHAEQAPNPHSRVRLGPQTDALGMPQLHVDWRATELDLRTVRTALAALADDLSASRCGHLHVDPAEAEQAALREGAYGGHHIGTARIATSPRHGVVDANCRVHGMDNLFIAGSAVFPTSSQANPTLTIVAMSLRLAAYLAEADGQGSKAFFFEKKNQKTFASSPLEQRA